MASGAVALRCAIAFAVGKWSVDAWRSMQPSCAWAMTYADLHGRLRRGRVERVALSVRHRVHRHEVHRRVRERSDVPAAHGPGGACSRIPEAGPAGRRLVRIAPHHFDRAGGPGGPPPPPHVRRLGPIAAVGCRKARDLDEAQPKQTPPPPPPGPGSPHAGPQAGMAGSIQAAVRPVHGQLCGEGARTRQRRRRQRPRRQRHADP